MLYLSELIHKPVVNAEKKTIGTLTDLVFVASQIPYITKLQVKNHTGTHLYPISAVKDVNGGIFLDTATTVPLGENEVYVVQNLLDQQIIDIKGRNIVRVNDVIIAEKPSYAISGIDIGLSGILRWFNLEKPLMRLLHTNLPQKVLPWAEIQPLELSRGTVVLNKEEDKLKAIAPEDLADYLEKTTIQNAIKILSLVNKETASEVIQNLNINFQTQIFRHMNDEEAAQIVTFADPDEAADLLLIVSDGKQKRILAQLSEHKRKELSYLLSHTNTAIGDLMTTEFLTFQPEDEVRTIMDRIKKETRGFASLPYGYVVNKKEELIGIFSMHELLLQAPETQAVKFMTQNVIVIHITTPINIAIKRILKFAIRAVPVIDHNRKILGIVTFDDLIEPILKKMS